MSRWIAAVTPQLPLRRIDLHLRDEMRRDQQVLPAPVLFEHGLQPVEIAERLVHVGLVDLDIAELDGGVALDDAVARRLAHDLRVDHRVLRHVDDEVAEDQRRAGQAAAFGQAAHALVALFLRALRRDVVVGGDDLVLGEIAFLHLDLAAPAGGAPAAHALDIDAERARGIEDRRADGKAPALARRHEQDERILDVGGRVHVSALLEFRRMQQMRAPLSCERCHLAAIRASACEQGRSQPLSPAIAPRVRRGAA